MNEKNPVRYNPSRLVATNPHCCNKRPFLSIRSAKAIVAKFANKNAIHPNFENLVLHASKKAPVSPKKQLIHSKASINVKINSRLPFAHME